MNLKEAEAFVMARRERPLTPLKMKGFLAYFNDCTSENFYNRTWSVVRKDDINNKILMNVQFSEPDYYHCCNMSVAVYENLDVKEYKLIVDRLLTYLNTLAGNNTIIYVTTAIQELPADTTFRDALVDLKFVVDTKDNSNLIYEVPPTDWIGVYMCLGVAIGMSLGMSTTGYATLGVAIGTALGAALGAFLNSKTKKERAALWNARINGTEPPAGKKR